MPQIYDMGPTALLPLRRKECWGFFRPKNPTTSVGFEPANLGTKGQHATSRPPKPLTSITETKTERVRDVILQNRRVATDEVAHQLQNSHGSAHEIIHNSLPSIKSVQDESLSNSKNCTKRIIWTSENGFWIAMMLTVTISWTESSRKTKHGHTIMSQRINARVWNGNILTRLPRESSKRIRLQERLCLQFFCDSQGLLLGRYQERVQQCTVLAAVWQAKVCSSKTAVRRRRFVAQQCQSSHCYRHRIQVFSDVTPWRWVSVSRRFEGS